MFELSQMAILLFRLLCRFVCICPLSFFGMIRTSIVLFPLERDVNSVRMDVNYIVVISFCLIILS